MAHYKSITIKYEGKYHNIRSVVGGEQLTDPQAKAHAIANDGMGKGYATVSTAVTAAKRKSKAQGTPQSKKRR